ncbi:MAG: hypothetical protein U0990_12490 [Candidatus Nanopelagicales bacterium]|nr:hypothetical protein [Candidatus Nanopelagicales bacterium]
MGFSAGTFSFTATTFAPTPVTGTTISSSDAATAWSEIATGLTTCVLKDGSQTATSSVPFAFGINVTSPLITPSTTFALVNTTATTVNFAGAATTLNIGATTGTATFSNPTLATAATTLTLFNTTATTVNFAGASTTTAIGAATGTITFAGSTIPQNSQSAAYTTVAADANKHILHPTADNTARTFTIDSNENVPYPTGTAITFVNQINVLTIAITADTLTLAGANTTGSVTIAAGGMATALKVTSTIWFISGSGIAAA